MKNKKIITLSGNPLSTQNAYGQRGKIRYMKEVAKQRKLDYWKEAKSQWKKKPLIGALSISITLFFGDKRCRDWDNFHKLSMDALTKVVWVDDSQIKEAHVRIDYDKKNPRIEVEIKPILYTS